MKSEERHKLQQNELADYLGKIVEKIKPYQNAILGGIILVLVLLIAINWWRGKTASEQDVANTEFYAALGAALSSSEPASLITMAEKYPDTPAANLAELTAADIYLNNGAKFLFENKLKANSELDQAVELYGKVLPKLSAPFLIARANYGLGRAEECQNRLPEAKKSYEEAVKAAPDSPYQLLASRRLADIERPITQENYANKFAKLEPKTFKENGNLLENLHFDPKNLPVEPHEPLINPDTFGKKLNLGIGPKTDLKSDDLLKDVLPAPGEQPAADQKKADESKPGDAAQPPPDSSKPADGAPPAPSDKPAETGPPAATPPSNPPTAETPAPAQNPPEQTPPPAADGK